MRKTYLCAFMALLVATPAVAQEQEEERPGVVAFSMWRCPFGNLQEAVQIANADTRDVYEDLVEEGMIQGWGVLTHLWGDEWNLVFYTLAEDAETAIAANGEYFRRFAELDTEGEIIARFLELCPEHKDNIMAFSYPSEDGEDGEM